MVATNGSFYARAARALVNRKIDLTSSELSILRKSANNGMTFEETLPLVPRLGKYREWYVKQKLKTEYNIRFVTVMQRKKQGRENSLVDARVFKAC